jgi:hypothetical protein
VGSWALEREAHQLLEPVGELAEVTGFARKGEVPVEVPVDDEPIILHAGW